MKNYLVTAALIICFATGLVALKMQPQAQVGVVSTVNSSDQVSVLRLAVNDLITLATSFSTTTANTWTALQTFTSTATSTHAGGIQIDGGGFQVSTLTTSNCDLKADTVGNFYCGSDSSASSTILADANTWSTAGTTTYSGNVKVSGNLQVSGTFFAPVQIVSSGDATINGALTVTGTTDLTGKLTLNAASSTFVTIADSLFLEGARISKYEFIGFSYSTTTWVGTTTVLKTLAPFTGTIQDISCDLTAGTLNAQMYVNSTAVTPMFSASTTAGTVTFSANNTFAKGDTIQLQLGTPASTPVSAPCTARTTVSTP